MRRVLRGLAGNGGGGANGGADGFLAQLHERGLIPDDARALRLFDTDTPRGADRDLRGRARGDRDRGSARRPDRRGRLAGFATGGRGQASDATGVRGGRAAGAAGRAAARLPRRQGERARLRGAARASTSRSSTSGASSARTSSPSTSASSSDGIERGLDATTTRSLMGSVYPTPGLYRKSFDIDQDPLVEVVQDTVGRHDNFGLACFPRYYEAARLPGAHQLHRQLQRRAGPAGGRAAGGLERAQPLLQHDLRRGQRPDRRRAVVAAGRLRADARVERPALRLIRLSRRHRPRQRLGDHRHPRPRLLGPRTGSRWPLPIASHRRPNPS